MRNKKGFTLIELLAIIIIIAVITLITVPIVRNMIKTSKKKAFEASLQSLISSAKTYYSSHAGDEFNTKVFTIKNNKIDELETKGKLPQEGIIEIKGSDLEDTTIPDGDISLQATDGTFCGRKDHKGELQITEDLSRCDALDIVPIDNQKPSLTLTTNENIDGNFIGVYAKCVHSSGIRKVEFSNDDGATWHESPEYLGNQYYHKFSNLQHNKWYTFKVTCTSNNGTSNTEEVKSILMNIDLPDFSSSTDWDRKREVIVSFPTDSSSIGFTYQYKIGEDDSYKTISTRSCNNNECSDKSNAKDKYTIEAVTGSSCAANKVCYKFTFYDETFNGTPLISNVHTTNDDSTNTFTISKIDRTAPTWNGITNPSNGKWTNQNITLTLKATDNSGSGIKNYKYSYSSNPSGDGSNSNNNWVIYTNSNKETFQTTPYTAERNQYSYFQVCDNVGNCSETNKTMIRIDKTAPTLTVNNPTSGHWNYSNQVITLIASGETNNTSGVEYYRYSYASNATADGTNNSTQWVKYTNLGLYNNSARTSMTASFTAERNQNAYFKVCDNAGNCSGTKSTKIMIDRTPPTFKEVAVYKWNSNIEPNPTSPTGTKIGNNTWIGTGYNALIYATAEDKPSTSGTPANQASGVKNYYGDIWGERGQNDKYSYGTSIQRRYYNIKTSGEYHATFMACDNAGNCSDMSDVVKINIDKEKPNVTLETKRDKKNGCYVHLHLYSNGDPDSLSGIASAKYVNSSGETKNVKTGWNGRGIPSNGMIVIQDNTVSSHAIDAQYLIPKDPYSSNSTTYDFTMKIYVEDNAGNKRTLKETINTKKCSQPEEKYYCKKVNGKWYDSNGKVVTEENYKKDCLDDDDSSSGGGGGGGTQCVPKTPSFLQVMFTEGGGGAAYETTEQPGKQHYWPTASGNTTMKVTVNANTNGMYFANASIPDNVLYDKEGHLILSQWTKVTFSGTKGKDHWFNAGTFGAPSHYYFYLINNCNTVPLNSNGELDRREITVSPK